MNLKINFFKMNFYTVKIRNSYLKLINHIQAFNKNKSWNVKFDDLILLFLTRLTIN